MGEAARQDSVPDAVGSYLAEIARTPLLTASEETELARMIEAGTYARHLLDTGGHPTASPDDLAEVAEQGRAAFDRMVRSNLRLVVSVARRYVRQGAALLDLVQDGNIGLIRAVEMYDCSYGGKFSTYAIWQIRAHVGKAALKEASAIRLPSQRAADASRARQETASLQTRLSRWPSPCDLAAATGWPEERAAAAMADMATLAVGSLDAPLPGDDRGTTRGDTVPDPSPDPADVASGLADADLAVPDDPPADGVVLACLTQRQREVMRLRLGWATGDPLTPQETARILGVDSSTVASLETRSIAKLRRALFPDGLPLRPVPGRNLREILLAAAEAADTASGAAPEAALRLPARDGAGSGGRRDTARREKEAKARRGDDRAARAGVDGWRGLPLSTRARLAGVADPTGFRLLAELAVRDRLDPDTVNALATAVNRADGPDAITAALALYDGTPIRRASRSRRPISG